MAATTLSDGCATHLGEDALGWLFDPTDIWGRDREELVADAAALRELQAPPLEGPSRGLVFRMLLQLESRIATQPLSGRSGDESRALTSVYELFPTARAAAADAGPDALWASDVIWWMLNRDVRPFTARWHRVATRGRLGREDHAERFRRDLVNVQAALRGWVRFYRAIITDRPATWSRPQVAPWESLVPLENERRCRPVKRDGMAVATPRAADFASLADAEARALEPWRAATGREGASLTGIALCGGGIRAATVALGVLRGLAREVDICAVDYFSTVSGGGYTGTLITSAFGNGVVDPACLGRGPFAPARDLGGAVIGWLRGQSQNMTIDAELVASVAGDLVTPEGGRAADVYRQRLAKTWIIGQPTSEDDDEVLPDLGIPLIRSGHDRPLGTVTQGPLQLWNLAINATNLSPLMKVALRGRQSDFYTLSRVGAECRLLGFRRADDAWTWTWSRAMALSGAALAPTRDDQQPRAVLAAFAAANINLGSWVDHATGAQQPDRGWLGRLGHALGISPAHEASAFLTDGGPVDNSGLYQLLRRQCAFILAVDAGSDPDMRFGDLANLQRSSSRRSRAASRTAELGRGPASRGRPSHRDLGARRRFIGAGAGRSHLAEGDRSRTVRRWAVRARPSTS